MNALVRYVSQNQFLTAIALVLLGWFILELRYIFVALFIAYILMAALHPFVLSLRTYRIPHVLAVLIPYFATIALIVMLIFPLIPFFIAQMQSLITKFPALLDQAARILGIQLNKEQLQSFITSDLNVIGQNALAVTSKVFGGLFSMLTILVVTFYLLMDHDKVKTSIAYQFPKHLQKKVMDVFAQIEEKLGAWLRGQIILSFFIGSLTWLALTVLGLDFALPLAILAGILEIVPTIGPILSSIPAIIVALAVSPTLTAIVVATYIVIQALENNLLVPKIMQHAVGLHPVAIILSVMIGANLLGAIGALLSIPLVSMLIIVYLNMNTNE